MVAKISIAALFLAFTVTLTGTPTLAAPAGAAQGKTCRMEQQCRWENFKKICTWVKVCR